MSAQITRQKLTTDSVIHLNGHPYRVRSVSGDQLSLLRACSCAGVPETETIAGQEVVTTWSSRELKEHLRESEQRIGLVRVAA